MSTLKIVSFKVAKALKEVGYPQGRLQHLYNNDGLFLSRSNYESWDMNTPLILFDAPYIMEAWLWLWREKGICLNTNTQHKGIVCIYCGETIIHKIKDMKITDPEEAIEAAINYIIENNLIK